MTKNKALVLDAPGNFRYETREIKYPNEEEVLVRVHTVCICGSDVHAINGKMPLFDFPRIIGHEVSAIVLEVGSKVHSLKIGDTVCLMPCISCGKCLACRHGNPNACESLRLYGVKEDGGLQEYMTLPEKYFLKLSEDMSLENASLIEPFTIGMHAVGKLGDVSDEHVLVLGTGPIGICCAEVLRTKKANVWCADISAERIARAREHFGFSTLDVNSSDYLTQILKITDGEGFYAVIDTTANKNSMEHSYKIVGQSGKIVFVGMTNDDLVINERIFHVKEATLYTTRNSNRSDYEAVARHFEQKLFHPEAMITHRTAFSHAKDVLIQQASRPFEFFKHVIHMVEAEV